MLRSNRGRRSFAAIWVVLGLALVGAAQPDWEEQDKLLASDGATYDAFGGSVSISGDWAIVGAGGDDDKGDHSGSVYIFSRDGTSWIERQKLLASDGAADDNFGLSVSISGDYAIVGASYDDDNGDISGSAYILTRVERTWTQQQKLLASDGAADDRFGVSVSISGDWAIVGAYGDNDNGEGSGSAYIFTGVGRTWTQQQKLIASDGDAYEDFGISVSISGDYAIVGAYEDDDSGTRAGSAYVFERVGTAWIQKQKLLASDGGFDDHFGASVSINEDYAIVGASEDNHGSAYVFERVGTAWIQKQKLLASDAAVGGWRRFGCSVSISGDYAIVGAYGDNNDNGQAAGSAYIFKWNGASWTEQQKLLASDGGWAYHFGGSVSISGDWAIVGATGDDDNGEDSGSAYIYKSTTSRIYRFWSPVNLRHFYTISESERNKLITNYSHVWTYEGVAYYAFSGMANSDLMPVYRFWSDVLAAHFYTISESEKTKLIGNYSDVWTFEGTAFYAYPEGLQPSETSPVYRFWSNSLGCHFYTISESERDKLIFQYSNVWTYEGTAWYAYE